MMQTLRWDPLDFLECLEVVPEVEDEGLTYVYRAIQDVLRLNVIVRPEESLITVALFREGIAAPLVEGTLFVRGSVRYVSDQRGEFLEIGDCMGVPDDFWHEENREPFLPRVGGITEIAVKPYLRVRFG